MCAARPVGTAFCGFAAILLAGCSSAGGGMYKQYGQVLKQSFGLFSKGGITRQQAAVVPYASLGYRINDGDQSMLVLATDTGGEQIWTAANHVVFQTRDGRLTRTVGLRYNLGAITPQQGSNAIPAPFAAIQQSFTSAKLVDFPEQGLYSMLLTCIARARGPETVAILGQNISTIRVDESCENRSSNWQFVDNYWLDPHTGLSWRSIQNIAPKGEKVEIDILRPPG
jgi:Group 4 capsule polysaccharide lipoprotein gfcB, YjbF